MATLVPNHALDSESRVADIIALSTATCVIAFTAVGLRFWTRLFYSKCFGMDDWWILAAMVVTGRFFGEVDTLLT